MGKWISIKKKKPKLKERVIIFIENEYISPFQIGSRIGKNIFFCEKWQSQREDISHWMPLLKKPKGLKNRYSKTVK